MKGVTMKLKELVRKTRSYRRFRQDTIARKTLVELVDPARASASAANLQPLKYFLSADTATNAKIFPHTKWAGKLKDWGGPKPGEQPTAYILILLDTEIAKAAGNDVGIAAQTIALGACEKGIGTCMIGSLDRQQLMDILKIPSRFHIELAIALGVPGETVVLEEVGANGSIDYYRDGSDIHHVPKRKLDDVIIGG
jgi:nitroreductase